MEQDRDITVIGKVLEGDADAYREIVSRHGDRIFSLVMGIVRNREDAEEVTSDIFLKVFGKLERFRGESNFSTWLYRIAYNAAISWTRKQKRRFADIGEERLGEISDEAEEAVFREARLTELERAMERLSGADRALIELFYMGRMSIEDISCVTSDTPGNVKIKLHRARKKLASMMLKS